MSAVAIPDQLRARTEAHVTQARVQKVQVGPDQGLKSKASTEGALEVHLQQRTTFVVDKLRT